MMIPYFDDWVVIVSRVEVQWSVAEFCAERMRRVLLTYGSKGLSVAR